MTSFNIPADAQQWLATGERGVSSETIFAEMTGLRLSRSLSHPWDPDDFRRCSLLLYRVPEWKARLPEMAKVSPEWAALVECWDELEEMLRVALKRPDKKAPEMYRRMKDLIDGARDKR